MPPSETKHRIVLAVLACCLGASIASSRAAAAWGDTSLPRGHDLDAFLARPGAQLPRSTARVGGLRPLDELLSAPAAGGASAVASASSRSAEALQETPPAQPQQAAEPEQPEYYENLYRKWGLSVGGAALRLFDTTIQVNSGLGLGADLDLEDLLGVDEDSAVVRMDAFYAFNRRHNVHLSLFDIQRSGTKVLLNSIDVGGVTLPAGEIHTSFDTLVAKLVYRYNFVADTRTVIGVGAGLHTLRFDTSFSSKGAFEVEESFKATAPLPVLGLGAEYALSRRWKLLASIDMLQVDIAGVRGFLSDTNLIVQHDPFEHFGWGIGFNGFDLNANIEGQSNLSADIEYGYQGIMLFLRMYF